MKRNEIGSFRQTGLRAGFLDAMSRTASTVTVVTTDGLYGRTGATVSAMSTVSADAPEPILLVCVHRLGSAGPAILKNGVFCVNVLREDQADISDVFAGRTGDGDRFSCTRWFAGKTGAPCMADPLVAFDCRLARAQLVGSHHVIFGAVADIHIAPDGAPLLHVNRDYDGLAGRSRAA
jgi:flavin reductase